MNNSQGWARVSIAGSRHSRGNGRERKGQMGTVGSRGLSNVASSCKTLFWDCVDDSTSYRAASVVGPQSSILVWQNGCQRTEAQAGGGDLWAGDESTAPPRPPPCLSGRKLSRLPGGAVEALSLGQGRVLLYGYQPLGYFTPKRPSAIIRWITQKNKQTE